MGLRFFGLTPEYRKQLFRQLHEIVFHGKGYNWWDVYNMPIWLRKFTIQSINEYHKNQAEEMKKVRAKGTPLTPKGPAIKKPTYSTKARK